MQGLEYADPPFFNPKLGSSLRMRLNTLEKESTEVQIVDRERHVRVGTLISCIMTLPSKGT